MDNPIDQAKTLALNYYRGLIRAFSSGSIDARAFEREYLSRFKREKILFGGRVYQILNDLFIDIDEYCEDPNLRDEDDIDEGELLARATIALEELEAL